MSTNHKSVAMVTSALVLLCASTVSAQETESTTGTSVPAAQSVQAPTQVQQPTVQQPPVQSVTVQQPAPQPIGTTTSTAGAYVAGSDTHSERTIERRPNRSLLSTGASIFVLSYGSSVVAGAVSDRDEDKRLFIPVVGPWMDLANRDCAANACGGGEDVAKAMIVTSGIVQGAGVLIALSSLIIPESTSITEHTTTAKASKPELKVLPVSFATGAGLGAVGRF